ncbi:hypothetical protein Trydic_g12524 [Trypoxylus dichotomus]
MRTDTLAAVFTKQSGSWLTPMRRPNRSNPPCVLDRSKPPGSRWKTDKGRETRRKERETKRSYRAGRKSGVKRYEVRTRRGPNRGRQQGKKRRTALAALKTLADGDLQEFLDKLNRELFEKTLASENLTLKTATTQETYVATKRRTVSQEAVTLKEDKPGNTWTTSRTHEDTQMPPASSRKKDTGGRRTEEGRPTNDTKPRLGKTSIARRADDQKQYAEVNYLVAGLKRRLSPVRTCEYGNDAVWCVRMIEGGYLAEKKVKGQRKVRSIR